MSSDYLFVQPSFLRGVSRVVDFAGTVNRNSYNFSETPSQADAKAILSDWQVLASDIGEAFATTAKVVERERGK